MSSTMADVVAANKLECVRGDREVSSVRVGVAVLLPRELRQLALVIALGATSSTPRACEPVHRSGSGSVGVRVGGGEDGGEDRGEDGVKGGGMKIVNIGRTSFVNAPLDSIDND